jgi:hypothetical protein
MNYRTIIGGAFLAVTIAACSTAVAAPEPSDAAPPARDQYYKDGPAAVMPAGSTQIETAGQNCRRQCP